jgi:succinate dehydrogenase / fumarate reductase, membrane anchor subunit
MATQPRIDMLRSPLSRARGLGSAREGAKHWWAQTVTSLALVPLTLWFIWSVVRLAGASQADIVDWMASPVRLALMLALIITTFYHLRLGLRVVIEDYVHQPAVKLAAVLAVDAACILLGLICAMCALTLGLNT